jgi:hypothetical protein
VILKVKKKYRELDATPCRTSSITYVILKRIELLICEKRAFGSRYFPKSGS